MKKNGLFLLILLVFCSALIGCELFKTDNPQTECTHEQFETKNENVVDATCIASGSYDLVKYCLDCGEELSREHITTSALGHNYESIVTNPTCTERGYTTHTCPRCGDSYVDSYVNALDHDYGDVTYTWSNDNAAVTATRICKRNNSHIETEAINTVAVVTQQQDCTHSELTTYTATFTNEAFKQQIKENVQTKEVLGHNYGEWIVDKEPTDSEFGLEKRKCSNCQEEETKAIAKIVYNLNGGVNNANNAILYADDEHISLLDPTRLGYKFEGWYLDESFKNPVSSITTFDNPTLNVYARWVCNIFYYEINDNKAIVTGYDKSYGITDLEIPSEYNGYIVTGIGRYAFSGCSRLTSITIPNSATSIGEYAFLNCTSLTSVTIGNSVTSIGQSAFSGCYRLVEVVNKSSIQLTLGSTDNGCVAYYAKQIITDEADSKLSTTNDGFVLYTDNTDVYLVSYVGNNTEVVIPNNVTKINDYAFYKCTSLTSITIPNNVACIGIEAFSNCTSLTSITIGNSVTSIGEWAFSNCPSLTDIVVSENNPKYDSRNSCNAIIETSSNMLVVGCANTVIPDSVTGIGYYAFYNCAGLTNITIPDNVTKIVKFAFYGCEDLESVTIGNGITRIGEAAFSECSSLENITISNSVTSIESYAFSHCTSLTSITIPDSVTSIGSFAFYNCESLTSITIPEGITRIEDGTFSWCESLTNITIPDSATSIGNYAFQNCTNLASVTIGSNLTNISDGAFYDCYRLVEVVNKSSLQLSLGSEENGGIAYYAKQIITDEADSKLSTTNDGFVLYTDNTDVYLVSYLGNNTDVVIPNNVTKINNYAFCHRDGLTSITIGNGVTNIGDSAFADCYNLVSVITPNSLTSIGDSAFKNCIVITSIIIPDCITNIGNDVFYNSGLAIIYYGGTASQYASFIDKTQRETIYYYSESKPVDAGNYWHYVDGAPVIWQ